MYNFCYVILSYNRANNLKTLKLLNNCNYPIVILCGDDEPQKEEYNKLENEKIKVYYFNKVEEQKQTDDGINNNKLKAVVYARNYIWKLMQDLNYEYFCVLDDDYISLTFLQKNEKNKKEEIKVKDWDKISNIMINFLKNTKIDCISFLQGGDLIGGTSNKLFFKRQVKKKIMNVFYCRTKTPFYFFGKINEDVNSYLVNLRNYGKIMFSLPFLKIDQTQTQKNKGGLTDIYLDVETYVKSFFSVMYCPSACKISIMGNKNKRIHHKLCIDNYAPAILRQK